MLLQRLQAVGGGPCLCLHTTSSQQLLCCTRKCRAVTAFSSRRFVGRATDHNGAQTTTSTTSPTPVQSTNSTSNTSASAFGPDAQAAAFTTLSATSAALGVAALAVPDVLLSSVLGLADGGSPLEVSFLRIAGATMAISAAVEYSLADAVRAGHLKSATYQRLLVAVIVKSATYIGAFLAAPQLWTPLLALTYPGAAGASILVSAATLRAAFRQAGVDSFGAGLAGLWGFGRPATGASWAYSVALVLYAATVAACYAPEAIFMGAPMTATGLLLKHTWPGGFLLAAAACWVLEDAANRGRLGASTFVRLNWGLAAVEAGYSAVFAAALASGLAAADGAAASNLAGSVVLASFCAVQALTAKKK